MGIHRGEVEGDVRVLSMTGEATVHAVSPHYSWHLQLRSLNHRFIEVRLYLPAELRPHELEIRTRLEEKLQRGQVTLYVRVECKDPTILGVPFDFVRLAFYVEVLKKISQTLKVSLPDPLAIAVRMPDVFAPDVAQVPEEDLRVFWEALNQAVEKLTRFREEEGSRHAVVLEQLLSNIERCAEQIALLEAERLEKLRSHLQEQIQQIHKPQALPAESASRLEEELVYWAQRIDIHEELVRLSAHIAHFRKTIRDTATIQKGKRLDFLAQEILREANTIAAKAQHARIQHLAVEIKECVDKIRELAANIL